MGDKEKLFVESLGNIVSLLANAWPSDRENVAVAGAEFEELAEEFSGAVGLRSLIDWTWKGLMYLFREDDYFLSVKSATMGAVNLLREYHLSGGDIEIEQVEKTCEALEKALAGESESADTMIDLDSIDPDSLAQDAAGRGSTAAGSTGADSATAADAAGAGDGGGGPGGRTTLDDLAAYLLGLDEHAVSEDELKTLGGMIDSLLHRSAAPLADALEEALDLVRKTFTLDPSSRNGWMARISELTEKAIQIESDLEWDAPVDGPEGEASPAEAESRDAVGQNGANKESPAGEPGKGPERHQPGSSSASDKAAPAAGTPGKEVFVLPGDTEPEMIDEFISECNDLIGTAESALLDLEETPDDDELVNTVFRAFHTIKGTSAFMGLDPVSEFTHSAETMLSMVRDGELPFDPACADISFRSIDVLKELLAVIESAGGGDPLPLPAQYGPLMQVLHKVSEEGVSPADALKPADDAPENPPAGLPAAATSSGTQDRTTAAATAPLPKQDEPQDVPEEEAQPATSGPQALKAEKPEPPSKKRSGSSRKSESDSSVRVSVSRLDRLVDMVGELVIAHSVVAQDSVLSQDAELQKKVNHSSKILRELQDTSLTLRMVPLKSTFQKMNRLVRDLSRKAGKPVTFSTLGEETEIDRNMVDIINEPLVHMLRNALDHGIEDPETRKNTGKPEVATIWFRAFQEGGKVVIEIEDDGKGIDKEKILEKAISKGLVEPDVRLSEKEIFNLIFAPGFSSVDKVTDLSGRGVGMDVVKRSIEQLQGKIDVSSQLGKGTKISLELPFTLAITDGMLIRVASQRFIIPIISIDMAFRPTKEDLYTVMGHSEQVLFQGKAIPVIRLHRLFNLSGAKEDLLEGTMLVVRSSNSRYALFVDDVIGQKQLVGKSIHMNVEMNHISGGAILEDGRVGLILDTAAIVN